MVLETYMVKFVRAEQAVVKSALFELLVANAKSTFPLRTISTH